MQTHTSFITMSVTQLCFPFGFELMVKRRTLLAVFTLILKANARDYGKGRLVATFRRGLWCLANYNALGQLANQSRLCLSEGGTLQKTMSLREAGHREPTMMCKVFEK